MKGLTFALITCSDTRSIETDEAGRALTSRIEERSGQVISHRVVTDELADIRDALLDAADHANADIILTCGGTGFSLRDNTPEATLAVAERCAPGISEAIRAQSMQITRRAMLSRGQTVLRGNSLIINLPGSTKAALEAFSFVEDQLEHGIEMLHGAGHESG